MYIVWCVSVGLTRSASGAVRGKKEAKSAVADFIARRQRPTEVTAAAVVRRTRTYSDSIILMYTTF